MSSRTIDGSTNAAGAKSPTYTILSSGSGTYTSPAGCTYIIVEAVGGGGGGGRSNDLQSAGAGGAGGYFKMKMPAGSYPYSIAAFANGASSQNTNGTAGNNTTFGTQYAFGGAGGQASSGRKGGEGGGVNIGGSGYTILYAVGGDYGECGIDSTYLARGGSSFMYVNGIPSISGVSSIPGNKGSGGAGSDAPTGPAGYGGGGYIVITEYY